MVNEWKRKNTKQQITTIFGTTQENPVYAGKLAAMIPADKRILIDNFCDRSLPCASFSSFVKYDTVIHGVAGVKKILNETKNITIIY